MGGPLGGHTGHEVDQDEEGNWPQRLLLAEGPDEHEYRFVGVALSDTHGNRPEYEFVETRTAE
jgi:hypothetical protein